MSVIQNREDRGEIEAHEILETAVFEYLKSLCGTPFALNSAFSNFKFQLRQQNRLEQLRAIAQDRGIEDSTIYLIDTAGSPLPPQDERILTEILSNLIRQGILVLGPTLGYAQRGWCTVSIYGEDCLQRNEIVPHDPNGYIALVKTKVSTLDPIIESYIEEACHCFASGCHKAAAVMCGVASERLMELFGTQLSEHISNKNHPKARKLTEALSVDWKISKLERAIKNIIETNSNIKGWPVSSTELERFIFPIFAWIKINRDSSGHPSDFSIGHVEVRGQLMCFVAYLEKLSGVIDYLSKAPPFSIA